MIRRLLSAAVLAGVLVGCSTAKVPMASAEADAAGKAFSPPPSGQGTFYIYREGQFGFEYLVTALAGQRTLGQLGADTWFRIDVEPGTQQLRCTTPEASEALQPQIAAGEIRFVEIAIRIGWAAPRCAIFEVTGDKGRAAVLAGRRALPL